MHTTSTHASDERMGAHVGEPRGTPSDPSLGNITSVKAMNIFVPQEMLTHFHHMIWNSAVVNVARFFFLYFLTGFWYILYSWENFISAVCLESGVVFCLSRVIRLSWWTSAILYHFSVVMCHVCFSLSFLYLLSLLFAASCFVSLVRFSHTTSLVQKGLDCYWRGHVRPAFGCPICLPLPLWYWLYLLLRLTRSLSDF